MSEPARTNAGNAMSREGRQRGEGTFDHQAEVNVEHDEAGHGRNAEGDHDRAADKEQHEEDAEQQKADVRGGKGFHHSLSPSAMSVFWLSLMDS